MRLHEPTFGEEEIQAVVDVMRSTQITSGKRVAKFEATFGPNAVMCNSGSSANLLAIAGLRYIETGFKPGDEVIVPALSWSTTVWPLIQHGLIPKIVDIDPITLNIDTAQAEEAISDRTRGIMVVHVYGNPCDMDHLVKLKEKGLFLIEDCCEAIGAKWRSQPVGYFGDVGTFSFYFSHHITTGEGGMCITRNPILAEKIRILRAHGWIRDCKNGDNYRSSYPDIDPKFLFVDHGYNLRCTEMQAAMGLVQLKKLDGFVEARQRAAGRLGEIFNAYPLFFMVQVQSPLAESSWFGFPITVSINAPFSARAIRAYFEKNGIETRSIICGNIARQPGLRRHPHVVHGDLKHSDHVMENGFSIGCHQDVDSESCDHVESVLHDFIKSRGFN